MQLSKNKQESRCPPAPIQQVFNISNSTVRFNQNELQQEAKRQRTCTSIEPIDVDAEIGLDFTLFLELLDWFVLLNRLLLQDVHLNFDLNSWRIILQILHVKKLH